MPLLTIADLLVPATQQDALSIELSIAAQLGLPTTAWQPLSAEMAILGANAAVVATYSLNVSQIAAGGYLTSAAVIPVNGALGATFGGIANSDGQGFTTTWMDLISVDTYNVPRIQPTYANGPVNLLNTSGSPINLTSIGQLRFQHPVTGATYSSTLTQQIPTGASASILIQADASFAGSSGNATIGTTLILLTPILGVSTQAQTKNLLGNDIETNAHLLKRCQNKLGSLSPNGATQAYDYVAESVPTAAQQSSAPFPFNSLGITVTAPITRVATIVNTLTGVVGVYIANATGSPPAGDVTAISNAIQALCVPLTVTATVAAVGTVALNCQYTVYIPTSLGLTSQAVTTNIDNALSKYCASVPIGGVTGALPNIVPYDELVTVIMNANPGTRDLQLFLPSGDLSISPTQVPVLGTSVPTVIFVT